LKTPVSARIFGFTYIRGGAGLSNIHIVNASGDLRVPSQQYDGMEMQAALLPGSSPATAQFIKPPRLP